MRELGFAAAFKYKTTGEYDAKLRELCPDGIDVYSDNIGGPITDAVFRRINVRARVCICGQISQYNLTRPEPGPRFLWKLLEKRSRVEWFLVFQFAEHYPEGLQQLAEWYRGGKLKIRETMAEGIENAPRGLYRDAARGEHRQTIGEGGGGHLNRKGSKNPTQG